MTVIHKLNKSSTHCDLCQRIIAAGHTAVAGEYVGEHGEGGTGSVYRIGENNKDSLCNGAKADTFKQI